ncbi:flavin-containing monooxygenase [Antrihabitans stalactiti]|uniref:NAD(P)/FAD-dependent oxidoreductase n=1 Tax=Antrihabitans stalactiti TaxID=2584121 RepID=A0A848KJN4_9NOCA|nr:NAD(P)/FAD-dependent oxidoreductase [Antrihabitans stalactiti]NMN98905.1 NAD(P)/FAD-dependent oxidoreductase [Antrihabitans stalactiti]
MTQRTRTSPTQVAPTQRPPDHHVVIIGAGLSGIGTAIELQRNGIHDIVLLERASDIGGTWRDNTYPGVGVDIPAHAYQFSYEMNPEWSRVFAKGHEVKTYIDHLADHYGLRASIRLNRDVTNRQWDEAAHLWRLTVSGREITARYVISAVGCFPEPKPPTIEGLDEFTGPILRSASWDHSIPLDGKRVAVVGTGASAVQLVPEIAPLVAHLDVYQRTPIWIAPKLDFPVPELVKTLFRRIPMTERATWTLSTEAVEAFLIGFGLSQARTKHVLRPGSRLMRDIWYRLQVADDRTRRALTPTYDFGCKRPAVSNTYLSTFNRGNVDLVTDPIERVSATGIVTTDGVHRPADVLVLATGFRTATDPEVYRRTPLRGRDGFDLADYFANNRARSYEGIAIPGLPNYFMVFGPYGWVGGTWHQLVETASTHIARVLTEAQQRGATAVEVREHAADTWTRWAADRMTHSVWAPGSCQTANSYYFDQFGENTFLRPATARHARTSAHTFALDDYQFECTKAPSKSSRPKDGCAPAISAASTTPATAT